jgi:hypothetical protein
MKTLATYDVKPSDVGQITARLPRCESCGREGRLVLLNSALGVVQDIDVGRRLYLQRFDNGAEVWQAESLGQMHDRRQKERLDRALEETCRAMERADNLRESRRI